MPIYCPHCNDELSYLGASGIARVSGLVHIEEHDDGSVETYVFDCDEIDDPDDYDYYYCPECDRTLTLDELVVRNDDDNETTDSWGEQAEVKNIATNPNIFKKSGSRARAAAEDMEEIAEEICGAYLSGIT